jgi:hypothetical protein
MCLWQGKLGVRSGDKAGEGFAAGCLRRNLTVWQSKAFLKLDKRAHF